MKLARFMIPALLLLSTALWAQEEVQDVVTAQAFHLTDSQGKIIAILQAMDDQPLFSLIDQEGNPRFIIGLEGSSCRILLGDAAGQRESLTISSDEKGSAILMSDADGKLRMAVGILENEPFVGFFDAEENAIGAVAVEDGHVVVKDIEPEETVPTE
ncbi:MAG: hypothetical protein ACYC2Y_10460 [Armatimonadota bacterium]